MTAHRWRVDSASSAAASPEAKRADRARASSFVLLVISVCGGCQAFDRGAFNALRTAALADAGAQDGSSGCGERARDGGTCELAVVPNPPPNLRNTTDPARMTRVYVMRQFTLGGGGEWRAIGFDRDGLCTSSDSSSPVACQNPQRNADGLNGRDNTLGSVVGTLGRLGGPFSEAALNDQIERGVASVAIRLRDFGGRDDAAFRAEVLPVFRGHAQGNAAAPPAWNGTDQWSVDRSLAYLSDGATPRTFTDEAFATCSSVVIPFPSTVPLYFANGTSGEQRSQLFLTDARLVGTLDAQGEFTRADVSALWVYNQILTDLRTFGACPEALDQPTWSQLLTSLDAALDLPESGAMPRPNAPCRAMSVGFRLTLVPAMLSGDAAPPPSPAGACADAGR